MANWQNCPAVERDPAKSGGVWVFRDTDVPLYRLYETLASGATVDDFAERFGVAVEHAAGGAGIRGTRIPRRPADSA